MDNDIYEPQVTLFKALMHPARLAILDLLRAGEQCVCHLEAALALRQAYISQQLTVLREAGLIQDRREGWNIYYQVTRPEVFAVIDAAARIANSHSLPPVNQPAASECPCPKCQTKTEPQNLITEVPEQG